MIARKLHHDGFAVVQLFGACLPQTFRLFHVDSRPCSRRQIDFLAKDVRIPGEPFERIRTEMVKP